MNPLHLFVGKEDSVKIVREKFSELFPALQIKIFKHIDDRRNTCGQDIMFCPEMKMNEIDKNFRDDLVQILDNWTVTDLESVFLDKFGLSVQVFRKNGNAVEESSRMVDFLLENTSYKVGAGFPLQGKALYFGQVSLNIKRS